MIQKMFYEIACLCIALLTSSCALISIQSPKNNASYKQTDTVSFKVAFTGGCADKSTFKATLDNQDITRSFTIAGNIATAPVRPANTLGFNSHTLLVEVSKQSSWGISGASCALSKKRDSGVSRFAVNEPYIVLTALPTNQTATWGQSVSYQIEVEGIDAFSGMVTLSASIPRGATSLSAQFNPSTINLTQNAPKKVSTLVISSIEGETPINKQYQIQINAVAGTKIKQTSVKLTLKRRDGAFSLARFKQASTSCGPVTADVLPAGSGNYCVKFSTQQKSTQCINFNAGYILNSPCRVSVVAMPITNLGFWNVGFSNSASTRPIPDRIRLLSSDWKQIWLSPDQSLAVIVAPDSAGGFSTTHVAILLNNLTTRSIDKGFSPGMVGTSPQVNNIQVSNDQVTIEYRDGSGNVQTMLINVP